jgi:hypothetical protein
MRHSGWDRRTRLLRRSHVFRDHWPMVMGDLVNREPAPDPIYQPEFAKNRRTVNRPEKGGALVAHQDCSAISPYQTVSIL